jgi:hypothetical protein
MLSQIPWTREGRIKKQIVPAPEEATGYMLRSGMIAYHFARWRKINAKEFAATHLRAIGAFDEVPLDLLEHYASEYEKSQQQ